MGVAGYSLLRTGRRFRLRLCRSSKGTGIHTSS